MVKGRWLLLAALTGALAGGLLLLATRESAAQPGERICRLDEVRPDRGYLEIQSKAKVGGEFWDHVVNLFHDLVWDIGGGWDLVEGWAGISDKQAPRAVGNTLLVIGDGRRLGSVKKQAGDRMSYFCFPIKGVRALTLRNTQAYVLILANVRLVKGRTTPIQPRDLWVNDGQVVYIEQPGEYKFHVR